VSRPLMPLLISSAGSTTSMASTPLMTRFMVRSARHSQHKADSHADVSACRLFYPTMRTLMG
jgi:hypothetical protein